ncbi:hypothetical protein [Cellulomonas sp. URHB0016]
MSIVAIVPGNCVPSGMLTAAPSVDEVVDRVRAEWAGGSQDVLLVFADPVGEEVARSVRLVLGATHLAVLALPLPPTALFVTANALQALPDYALGLAPELLEAVAGTMWTRVLLSSVSGLERPAPSLGQDLASRLPGQAFLVDWTAQTVIRSSGELRVPAEAVGAVVSASEKPVLAIDRASWPVRDVLDLQTPGTFWGAKRWFELSLVTVPPAGVAAWVVEDARRGAAARCPACGRVVAGASCVFCQVGLPLDVPQAVLA